MPTLLDVALTSDQAITSSLFPSSTILMLKLVMNYFLQSFPFLLIERRTVVSHWQNPTPGPFYAPAIRRMRKGIKRCPCPSVRLSVRPCVLPFVHHLGRYFVSATPPTIFPNPFETLQVFLSMTEDVHDIWI